MTNLITLLQIIIAMTLPILFGFLFFSLIPMGAVALAGVVVGTFLMPVLLTALN